MKTPAIIVALLFLSLACVQAQTQATATTQPASPPDKTVPAPTPFRVMERGANHKVWQRETYEKGPNGEVRTHVHKYTELASGMHYQDANGQWVESKDLIEAYSGGAIARQGQYQVNFANNLNTAGAIDQQTPDGKRLRSNILGLSYYDSSTGQSVLIGQIQDSQGELISSNQVLYPNAFSGVKADVRYTYKRGSFEQDVVLREQPPAPESLGLNPRTTEIQVMTEFLNPPEAVVKEHKGKSSAQSDQSVSWGAMTLGRGRAFDLGEPHNSMKPVSVTKQYDTIQGRKILLEIVPVKNIQTALQKLPLQSSINTKLPTLASKELMLPRPLMAQAEPKPMKLAYATPSNKGFVLDYIEINSDQTNYTFQGDTTYYVSGEYNMLGTTTIEGGTVIKMDGNGWLAIDVDGTLVCQTGPYRPATFTSINDNSVGESLGSGSPSQTDVEIFIVAGNISVHDLRFSYFNVAIGSSLTDVTDCQFFNSGNFSLYSYDDASLHNVLFSQCGGCIFFDNYSALTAENVTADTGSFADFDIGGTLAMTNCLIVADSLAAGSPSYLTNSTAWIQYPVSPLFQSVGGGNYYLTNGSPYRNAGTTNISPKLLAELRQRTTYPPVIYANTTFSTPTNFAPRTPRDTNSSPDYGYHYDALDYVFGHCQFNTNITFSAGTATAWYRPSSGYYHDGYGIFVNDRQTLTFAGTASALCWWVRLNVVQENDTSAGYGCGGIDGEADQYAGDITRSPIVQANFLHCSEMAADTGFIRDDYGYIITRANNSEFYCGGIGCYGASYGITNCLFYRAGIANVEAWAGNFAYFLDCTFYGGSVGLYSPNSMPIVAKNNSFDGTTFDLRSYANNATYATYDYNAYTNSSSPFAVGGAHDVVVSGGFNWQSSWLGNYYLPSDSPVIDAGSTNANLLGLYHFTTQTNQVKETNSLVDIGYHYVATDASGNPVDTNGDGIPDYLEDANGDGLVNFGELGWNWADPRFHVWITQPRNNSTLP